jgi:hypothetical protein
VLVLEITSIVVLPVLALVFYVVWRINPGRFRLSIEGGWKQIKLSIEVDAQDKPKELPLRLTFAQTDMRFLAGSRLTDIQVFSVTFHVSLLCSNSVRTRAARAMAPISLGLAVTC